jgi:hypothetical protein
MSNEHQVTDLTTFFHSQHTRSLVTSTKGKILKAPKKEAVRANGETEFSVREEFLNPYSAVMIASSTKADQLMDPEYFHVFNCFDTSVAADNLRSFFHTHDIHPEVYASRLKPPEPVDMREVKRKLKRAREREF